MYLGRVMTTLHDTIRIHQDTLGVHEGYKQDTCKIHVSEEARGYIQDTCRIHPRYMMRYMYLKFIQTDMYLICGIHEGYIRDT